MRIKAILNIVMLIMITYEKCDKGCLKCDLLKDICEVCDSKLDFILQSGICVKKEVSICERTDAQGLCIYCKPGFYLDKSKNLCMEVTEEIDIDNCRYYGIVEECTACKADFFLHANYCVQVPKKIENCDVYLGPLICARCKEGFLVSADGAACKAKPGLDNCQTYSNLKCQECKVGATADLNYLTALFYKQISSNDPLVQFLVLEGYQNDYLEFEEGCVEGQVQNCSKHKNLTECEVCEENYFLSDKNCYPFPKEQIPNCARYKNEKECMECIQKFYLKSSTDCVAVEPILNCELYSPTEEESRCILCYRSQFLVNNICNQRTNLVDLCSVYSVDSDKCEDCLENNVPTSDGKKCLPLVENCLTYQTSSIKTSAHICAQCDDLYYLFNSACEVGTVDNCLVYTTTQNSCAECEDSYYLSNGACEKHQPIENCLSYHKNNKDKCVMCKEGNMLMMKTTDCIPVNIDGCKVFANQTQCAVCKDGYDKISEFECVLIQPSLNCVRAISGICQQCEKNFLLINEKCIRPYDYEMKFCEESNLDGFTQSHQFVNCNLCSKNSIPLNYKNHSVCVENSEMEILKGGYLTPDCLTYKKTESGFECIRCANNFVLNEGLCLSNCGDKILQYYHLSISNGIFTLKNKYICVDPDSDDGCRVRTVGILGGNYGIGCLATADTHLKKMEPMTEMFVDSPQLFIASEDFGPGLKSDNVFSLPIFQSLLKDNSNKIRGVIENEELPGCEVYYDLHDNWLGCLKCNFKKYGPIFNWKVDNCNIYDDTNKNCLKCNHGYYKENPLRCTKQPVISGCERYSIDQVSQCRKCFVGYYLNTSGTTCTKNSIINNCELYSLVTDTCAKCKVGFVRIDTGLACLSKIQDCSEHLTSANPLQCVTCDFGFYPATTSTSKDTCAKGSVSNCWLYDQTAVNTCLKYDNLFVFEQQNTCVAPNPISGCLTYASTTSCQICDASTHYLTNNVCCPYEQYWNGSSCVSAISNCKINTTTTLSSCDQCLTGYLFINNGTHQKCCPPGSYINSSGVCKTSMMLSLNTKNCLVFDQFSKSCVFCASGYYLRNQFQPCCQEGFFFNTTTSTCDSITLTNCKRLDANSTCTKCNTDVARNLPNCCTTTEYWNGSSCLSQSGCSEYEYVSGVWRCKTCLATHYKLNPGEKCCLKNTQYYDGSNCQTVTATKANCEQFNSSQACVSCVDNYSAFNQGLFCCVNTQFWDSRTSGNTCVNNINNLGIFDRCLEVDQVSTPKNKCKTCEPGYYLFNNACVELKKYGANLNITASNCLKLSEDLSTCTLCEADYYWVSGTICCKTNTFYDGTSCVPLQNYSQNCAYLDLSTHLCANIAGAGGYQCAGSGSTKFYWSGVTGQERCCEEGKTWDNTTKQCVALSTATNCLRVSTSDAQANCSQCVSSNFGIPNCATTFLANCKLSADGTVCDECNDGYFLFNNSGSSPAISCQPYSHFTTNVTCDGANGSSLGKFTKYCKKSKDQVSTSADKCKCDTCNSFSYEQSTPAFKCCPLGYYWVGTVGPATINKCLKIKSDYCAKSNDGENCTECFVSKNYCTISSNIIWTLDNTNFSLLQTQKINGNSHIAPKTLVNARLASFAENYLSNNKCCPLGLYYNSNTSNCEEIPVKNCTKYESSACTACKDEYVLTTGYCCRYDEVYQSSTKSCVYNAAVVNCETGKYKSNGKCCLENYYYDKLELRCKPLFDPNCLRSDSKFTCSTCASGFKLEPSYGTIVQFMQTTPDHCQNIEEKHYVRFCISETHFGTAVSDTAKTNNIVDYEKFQVMISDCHEFSFPNKKCTTCKTGAYKAESDSTFCCEDGFFDYQGKCRKIENFIANCSNYDHTLRRCLECKNSYYLTEGVCCAQNYFLNRKTWKCDIQIPFCKSFDVFNAQCTECISNYYMSVGRCCPEGTYYDLTEKSCMTSTSNPDCKKFDSLRCYECFSDSDVYLHNGLCCKKGSYSDGSSCSTNFTSDLTMQNCLIFDEFLNCSECKSGSYFHLTKCCPEGTYFDPTLGNCKAKTEFKNCKKFNNTASACVQCFDSYYVSNAHCCAENYVWNDTEKLCLQINLNPNCVKVDDNDNCIKCAANYYITNNRCCKENYWYNTTFCDLINTTTLPNCLRKNNNSNNCLKCITGYIANSAGVCGLVTGAEPTNCYKFDAVNNCLLCADTYYITNGNCCQDNFFWNGTECSAISPNSNVTTEANCLQIQTGDALCTKCAAGYYVDNGECSAEDTYYDAVNTPVLITDCKKYNPSDHTKCVMCITDKVLVDDTTCSAPSGLASYYSGCSLGTVVSSVKCTECPSSGTKYLVNGVCCDEGKRFSLSKGNCVPIDVSNNLTNCLQIDGSNCAKCENSFYLTNGICCKGNFIGDSGNCVKVTTPELADCNQYANSTTCVESGGCLNNKYVSHGKCCSLYRYWKSTATPAACTALSEISQLACQRVDSDHNCIECANVSDYFSYGHCCPLNQFFRIADQSCVSITERTNCRKIDNNVCTDCTGQTENSSECCNGYYFNTSSVCVIKPTSCLDVKNDGTCTSCTSSTSYLSNGRCCNLGFYYNGTSCVVIPSSLSNCRKVVDVNLGVTPSVCTKCNTGFEVRNGVCCSALDFYLNSACTPISLVDKCLQLNNAGECLKCASGFYPTTGICCALNKVYNSTTKTCDDIPLVDNCQKMIGSTCTECLSTHYLNTNISKCCPISYPHAGSICATSPTQLNCNGFSSIGNCTSCQKGYVLYSITDGSSQKVCCKEGEYYDGTYCQSLLKVVDYCRTFDQTNMQCLNCNTTHFLGNKHCCALNTQFWTNTTKQCAPQTLPNCAQEVETSLGNKVCTVCSMGAFYLQNGGCCELGTFWNGSNCVDILILDCEKYDGVNNVCLKCFDEFNLYQTHTRCCPNNRWWNNTTATCEEKIKNCKIYDDSQVSILCKECAVGFNLSFHRTSCCANNNVFFKNADFTTHCQATPEIDSVFDYCTIFDPLNLVCLKCKDTHYVSYGICCPRGQKKNLTTFQCEVVASPPTNCDQFTDSTSIVCAGCVNGKKLSTALTCVNIFDNCVDFNPNTPTCTKCNSGTYLSDGYCCTEGNRRQSTNLACEPIPANQYCVKWNSGICSQCLDGFYKPPSLNSCCKIGTYCASASSSVSGTISNCERYSTSATDCIKCNKFHALVSIANPTRKYCFQINVENCEENIGAVVSTNNTLTCQTCQNQFYSQNLTTKPLLTKIHSKEVFGCLKHDNTNLITTSSLNCYYCENGKYLDPTNQLCIAGTKTNCVKLDRTSDVCILCNEGYYLFGGQCYPHNENRTGCLYFNGTYCTNCASDYYDILSYTSSWSNTCILKTDSVNENIEANPPEYFKGFINKCIENEECSSEYLNGLPNELKKYVSCHKCLDEKKIPFISIRGGDESFSIEGIQRYNIKTQNNLRLDTFNTEYNDLSNKCLSDDLSDFSFLNAPNFPENCGIGVINANIRAQANLSNSESAEFNNLGVYCGACKPGYAPLMTNIHVYQCDLISNCAAFGGSFNECDKCVDTHSFEYKSGEVNFGKCISNQGYSNCYAFNADANNCFECKKGYSRNPENKCELINAPDCEAGHMSFNNNHSESTFNLKMALYRGESGCTKCLDNMSGLYQETDEFVCTESSYVRLQSFVQQNPVFSLNCELYSNNGSSITCGKCIPNFILGVDGKCYPSAGLQNCILASTNTICNTCADTHVLVNNACLAKNISNCMSYAESEATLTCSLCEAEYYLSNNVCHRGNIFQCKFYADENRCNFCHEGYEKIVIKENINYCTPVNSHLHCSTFDQSAFQNQTVKCSSCNNQFAQFYLINLPEPVSVCNKYNLISNCASYDKTDTFLNSTFLCRKCDQGYYLHNNSCLLRTVFIESCKEYTVDAQICKQCEGDFYLNNAKNECLSNPKGLVGCLIYRDENTCVKCYNNYYLEDNKCIQIATEKIVPNCISYSSPTTCQECEPDKFLNIDSNACEVVSIPDCAVFLDKTNCRVCKTGFGIVEKEGVKGCVAITAVPNCIVYAETDPFPCMKCLSGFYLKDSVCTAVNPLIPQCSEYESNELCIKCTDMNYLSADKKKCIAYYSKSLCGTYTEENEAFCVLCKPGYKLDENRKCVIDVNMQSTKNCLFLNPLDNKDCIICRYGYYQDLNKECVFGGEDVPGENDNNIDNNPDNTDNQKDARFIQMWNYLLVLIFFLYGNNF